MNRAQTVTLPTIIFFLLSLVRINAQSPNNYTFKNTSLDIVTDAASVALGESFVANPANQYAYFENPAAISTNTGMQIFYNYRSLNWMPLVDKQKYFSAGGSVATSIGNFGFAYNQFSTGEISTSSSDPNITSTDVNRTFLFSYSNSILKDFYAGASVKLFNRSLNMKGMNYSVTSNNAFLFDAGLLYQATGFFARRETKDKISAGISLQNFGTDYKEELKYIYTETYLQKLPRYFRVGFAYSLNTVVGQQLQANLDLQLTGEYKRLLNPGEGEQNDVNYWGAGIQAALFKVVSFRLGGVSSPEDNLLWDKNKFNFRYGIGLNFPLAVLGLDHPITIRFDYAVIPINKTAFENSQNSLYAFTVSLSYGAPFLK